MRGEHIAAVRAARWLLRGVWLLGMEGGVGGVGGGGSVCAAATWLYAKKRQEQE